MLLGGPLSKEAHEYSHQKAGSLFCSVLLKAAPPV